MERRTLPPPSGGEKNSASSLLCTPLFFPCPASPHSSFSPLLFFFLCFRSKIYLSLFSTLLAPSSPCLCLVLSPPSPSTCLPSALLSRTTALLPRACPICLPNCISVPLASIMCHLSSGHPVTRVADLRLACSFPCSSPHSKPLQCSCPPFLPTKTAGIDVPSAPNPEHLFCQMSEWSSFLVALIRLIPVIFLIVATKFPYCHRRCPSKQSNVWTTLKTVILAALFLACGSRNYWNKFLGTFSAILSDLVFCFFIMLMQSSSLTVSFSFSFSFSPLLLLKDSDLSSYSQHHLAAIFWLSWWSYWGPFCLTRLVTNHNWQMVRVLVATSIREAAAGADEDALLKLIDATCRRATAPPAPPDGLCLVDVGYAEFTPQNCLIPKD